jgi:hypothetical protein
MAKGNKTIFVCNNCGNESSKWLGKCPACGEWNSFFEEKVVDSKVTTGLGARTTATKANTVKSISISGKTITVTPGSGSAYTLTTQDTTYSSLPANGGTSTATAYMNQYDTITYGVNRLQYYNISTSTTSGAANNANPTNDWYYHLLMSHANSAGYYGDLAMCFHANTLAFRRIQSGSDQGWCYLVKNGRTIVSGYEVYVG